MESAADAGHAAAVATNAAIKDVVGFDSAAPRLIAGFVSNGEPEADIQEEE